MARLADRSHNRSPIVARFYGNAMEHMRTVRLSKAAKNLRFTVVFWIDPNASGKKYDGLRLRQQPLSGCFFPLQNLPETAP